MKLIGVDIGFSKNRKTTGIACLDDKNLCLRKARTDREDRKSKIPNGFHPSFAAFDGPILSRDTEPPARRSCEFLFIHAPFPGRCKPGLSHFGTGLELRNATRNACKDFSESVVLGPIVEAFPNAFLAVLLPESSFPSPRLERGKRFDWLYNQALEAKRLEKMFLKLDLPDEVWQRVRSEKDHELRAALVCLLTAAFVSDGRVTRVGESTGGWFCLPPLSLWEPWAKRGLKTAGETIIKKGHARIDVCHEV